MPKSYSELLPSVERRLSAWISLGDQRRYARPSKPRPTVTISRRFGCEAFPLAERLKELFESATGETWNVFDKTLLERVCQDEHLSRKLLDDLGGPSRAADSIGFLFSGYVSHKDAFRCLARHVVLLAEAGNAIIVGRGGAVITRHLSNCYHFRLDASDQFCVAATMRRLEVSEKEAVEMVRDYDRMREGFIEDCLKVSGRDLVHYHAVFNRDRSGVDEIARSILAFIATSWSEKSYFRAGTVIAGV
jgi:hypothetical protein